MATTITLANFIAAVKRQINEAGNTPVGELVSGTSGTATTTTDALIEILANQGIAYLCTNAFLIRGQFNYANVPAGTRDVKMDDLSPITGGTPTTPTGSKCWKPEPYGVYYNSLPLIYTSKENLGNYNRGSLMAANGTPARWSMGDERNIALDPAPTSAVLTLTVFGYMIPPPVDGTAAMTDFIPDDIVTEFLQPYCGGMLCQKQVDDPDMAGRAPGLLGQAQDALLRYRAGVPPQAALWAFGSYGLSGIK